MEQHSELSMGRGCAQHLEILKVLHLGLLKEQRCGKHFQPLMQEPQMVP
jgi:hypothetical protein